MHDYLGMRLDYSLPGQVSIDMSHYVEKMVKEFPQENLKGAPVASPWNENVFTVQHNSAPLEKEQANLLHTVTVQGLFLSKHGHLGIAPAIACVLHEYKSQIMQIGLSYVECCNFSTKQ